MTPFNRTHWLFSYEFGFLKRGLPGELLRQLNGSTAGLRMDRIALLLFFPVTAALVWNYSRPARREPGNSGSRLFLLRAGADAYPNITGHRREMPQFRGESRGLAAFPPRLSS